MWHLTVQEVAIRATGLWLAGLYMLVWASGYSARPGKRSEKSMFILMILIIPGKIFNFMGPAGIVIMIAKLMHSDSNDMFSFFVRVGALFVSLYVNSLILQNLQNAAYRYVGANTLPIRWKLFDGKRRPTRGRKK